MVQSKRAWTAAMIADLVAVGAAVAAASAVRAVRDIREQAWFWTPTWLEGEQQASADIAAGRVRASEDHNAFVKALLNDGPPDSQSVHEARA